MDTIRSGSVLPLNVIMIPMNNDVEAYEYDIGVTSVRLIRVGNVIQILFSKKLSAKIICQELVEKFKRDQEQYRGV